MNFILKPFVLGLLALSLYGCDQKGTNKTGTPESVKKQFEDKHPKAEKISSVKETSVPGIYELVIGKNIIYSDADVDFLFIGGDLIDVNKKVSLTEGRLQELNAIDIKSLPLENAIKEVRGKGERVIYVFSDPDCPYCKTFENTLANMDNLTVYTFMYPVKELHPEAEKKSRQIWCSETPLQSWHGLMRDGKEPEGKHDCVNPIQDNIVIAERLGVMGTPSVILSNGMLIPQALNAEQLEQALATVEATTVEQKASAPVSLPKKK